MWQLLPQVYAWCRAHEEEEVMILDLEIVWCASIDYRGTPSLWFLWRLPAAEEESQKGGKDASFHIPALG